MLYNIKTFVGRTWKDLELYRALIEKYPSYLWPYIRGYLAIHQAIRGSR